MRFYIVSGILLIVPIVDFALAAPVLVQEKRQACDDIANIFTYPITVLEKRGWIEKVRFKYIDNWFANPEESSVVHEPSSSVPSKPKHRWAELNQPLPSIPEESSPASSPDRAPNPGPSTEPDHLLTGMGAPLSPVYPTYFHELPGAHESQPNRGPSNPSTEFDSDHELVAEEPLSPTKGSPIESGYEMVDMTPSGSASTTDPNRQAKESRRNSGTARDVGNAA